MDQFICLRMIQMNGVDLARFQFDYDMSFAVIFMNADGMIYGRFGTRDAKPEEADRDISLEGMRAAMEAVLALHRNYPDNAASLVAKRGPTPRYPTAEQYPKMKEYTPQINYDNEVAKSCIHCHQIHDAERQEFRDAFQPVPPEILYPYPMPEVIGITLDPRKRASVRKVAEGSAAAKAGIKVGDELVLAQGQALVSVADFQWVLHRTAASGAEIPLQVRRSRESVGLTLNLESGWRTGSDFGWRVSTWDLRRMVLGGMVLEPDKSKERIPLGLRVKNVGRYGNHAVARDAGVRPDDRLVSVAGVTEESTEAELIAHILEKTKKGDHIPIRVLRGGQELDFSIKTQ